MIQNRAPHGRGTGWLQAAKVWAKAIKRDVVALWLAARDPRVPWYAKAIAGFVAAYGLSPIDLIPDFIPIVGYLDDIIICRSVSCWRFASSPRH